MFPFFVGLDIIIRIVLSPYDKQISIKGFLKRTPNELATIHIPTYPSEESSVYIENARLRHG